MMNLGCNSAKGAGREHLEADKENDKSLFLCPSPLPFRTLLLHKTLRKLYMKEHTSEVFKAATFWTYLATWVKTHQYLFCSEVIFYVPRPNPTFPTLSVLALRGVLWQANLQATG